MSIATAPKIDFHAHFFPLKKARATVEFIANSGIVHEGVTRRTYTDGTCEALLKTGREYNVKGFVLLPITANPGAVIRENDWAAQIAAGLPCVIPFGTVHPKMENPLAEIDRIKTMGFKGIKIHTYLMGVSPLADTLLAIYEKMARLGLIALFDTGNYDKKIDEKFSTTPDKISRIIAEFPTLKIVAAHLGSYGGWDDVLKHLAGKDLWLDTAYAGEYLKYFYEAHDLMINIIRRHGADRILFGTDTPYSSLKSEIDFIRSLPLTDKEKRFILMENAVQLLGLNP